MGTLLRRPAPACLRAAGPAPIHAAIPLLLVLAASCGSSDVAREAPRFVWAHFPGKVELAWTPAPTDAAYGNRTEAPRLAGRSSSWSGHFEGRIGRTLLEVWLESDGDFWTMHHPSSYRRASGGCGGPYVGQTSSTGTWSLQEDRVVFDVRSECEEGAVSFRGATLERDVSGFVLSAGLGQDVYAD